MTQNSTAWIIDALIDLSHAAVRQDHPALGEDIASIAAAFSESGGQSAAAAAAIRAAMATQAVGAHSIAAASVTPISAR